MNAGDPIWYRHAQRGGYCFASDVPGTFVRQTAKKVTVSVFKKDGSRVDVSVDPKNVRARDPKAVWR